MACLTSYYHNHNNKNSIDNLIIFSLNMLFEKSRRYGQRNLINSDMTYFCGLLDYGIVKSRKFSLR